MYSNNNMYVVAFAAAINIGCLGYVYIVLPLSNTWGLVSILGQPLKDNSLNGGKCVHKLP